MAAEFVVDVGVVATGVGVVQDTSTFNKEIKSKLCIRFFGLSKALTVFIKLCSAYGVFKVTLNQHHP
ncbi:hypothetical protein [Rufibacter roseus]|uniref:Uncharacterized protein n=1 Tax=Rufibacter roseus TaxID=1567108 RepID=A0ABW2DR50_9BACT|nr:hypothetical protein [Rufibacter roseus]